MHDDRSTREAVRRTVLELAPSGNGGHRAGALRLVEDLQYDSLTLLELAFALESAFSLPPFDEAAVASITTVDDLEDYVVATLRVHDAGLR